MAKLLSMLVLRLFILLVLLMPAAAAAAAPALPEGFAGFGAGRAVEIIDGDTLVLEDGREVRLVGIQAPKLPLGRPDFKAWPLAEEARAALVELAEGQALTLHAGGARMDRHGRVLAHLVRADGLWIQGEMLRRGMARVYSFPDNRKGVDAMLAVEAEAREAARGIWAHDFYRIRDKETIKRHPDGFQIVEDRVHGVAAVGKVVYLNFEPDWRRDFTITLDRRTARELARRIGDLEGLEGRRVRVRGWVKRENGPMITVNHPEQLELLDQDMRKGSAQ